MKSVVRYRLAKSATIPPSLGVLLGVSGKPLKGDTPSMPLSDATIRTLKPRDKAYKVSDFEGLFLTVKPTGSRLWHFKYRIAGKEKLLSLGIYPGISLAQARIARDAARGMLATGQDPGVPSLTFGMRKKSRL